MIAEQPFTHTQLFNLKRETLEERIMTYYQESQNSSTTIQLLIALRVRYQLGAKEFALVLQDLVHYLFTHTKATKTMKRFFWYFADYFDTKEWRKVSLRIFPIRKFIEKAKSLIVPKIAKLFSAEPTVT